jgi:hypothetical protein
VAHLHFLRPAGWIHLGDVFRPLFSLFVLVGAARWVCGYWRGLAGTAVADERRRIGARAARRRGAGARADPPSRAGNGLAAAGSGRAGDHGRREAVAGGGTAFDEGASSGASEADE